MTQQEELKCVMVLFFVVTHDDYERMSLGIILPKVNNAVTPLYAFTDNLGSVTRLYTETGVEKFRAQYDPWGVKVVNRNNINFARGYCGHEMLNDFQLINMNGRMYDPVLGRFLSPDNYVQMPTSAQSFNRYSYCLNNPLKYTDPSGELFGIDNAFLAFALYNMASSMMLAAYNGQSVLKAGGLSLLSSAASYGIGSAFGGVGNFGHELLRAGSHGFATGAINALGGGSFGRGFLTGALSSGIGSFAQGVHMDTGLMLASTTAMGGLSEWATGGDFLSGAMQGLQIGLLNHAMHGDDMPSGNTPKETYAKIYEDGTMEWFVIGYKPVDLSVALTTGSIIATLYSAKRYYKSPMGTEYWRTSSGKIYDSSILKPQPNGKYVRGVQGIRNSKEFARKAVRVPSTIGKILGGLGVGSSSYNFVNNPNAINIIDLGRSLLSYRSLPYAMIDFYISISIESMRQNQLFNLNYGLPLNQGLYNPTLGQYW